MKNKQGRHNMWLLLLALTLVIGITVPAVFAAGTAQIAFGKVSGERAQKVTVPVTITNNPGIASFRFRVAYDATALTYKSAAKGEAMTGGTLSAAYQTKDEELAITWFDVRNITGDGVIFNLVFDVANTAGGQYPLTVSYLPEDIVNATWKTVDCIVVDGNVHIHTWNDTLSFDKTQHWTACSGCDEKKLAENHYGGTANCQQLATCAVCKQTYGELETCNFIAEKTDSRYLKTAATCKSAAVYYKSCTVCGETGEETFTYGGLDTSNHTGGTELRDASEPNCTTPGHTGNVYCKGCNKIVTPGSAIPVRHKLEKVAENPATHEAPGNIAHYECSKCGKLFTDENGKNELSEADVIIAKIQHTYAMEYDSSKHWRKCECGSTVDEGDHTYGNWVVVTQPQYGVAGSEERNCSVCGYKQTKDIPALTFAFGDVDRDGDMDTDDAVYLLLYVMFGGEDYPVADNVQPDMDGNGSIDTDDAVYLLLHVMFGEEDYPLAI